MKDNQEINLKYNRLPYTYNCDEIKKLNSVTNASYTVGFLKREIDIPIAIIGLPPTINPKFLEIKLSTDKTKLTYNFYEATSLEKDYTNYIVYPYQKSYEDDKELQHVHNLIISSRKNAILENSHRNQNPIKRLRKK